MERHANYALVGVVTTVLVIGGLIFAVWLGNFGFMRRDDHYRIIFTGPISGMSEGTVVEFNGIKVGEVEHIDLLPENPTLISADIKVRQRTPVRDDSLASPEGQGISGVNIVQITAGTAGRPLLREVDHSDRPLIRSKLGGMASLLAGGTKVVEQANVALSRINMLLSERNVANLSAAMKDVRATTEALARNRAMFGQAASAIAKLDVTATDLQATVRSARGLVDGDGRRAVSDVAAAARDLRETLADARKLIVKLDAPVGQINATTLPAISASMVSIQQAADALEGLVHQIKQDPHALIGKRRGKELELPK